MGKKLVIEAEGGNEYDAHTAVVTKDRYVTWHVLCSIFRKDDMPSIGTQCLFEPQHLFSILAYVRIDF